MRRLYLIAGGGLALGGAALGSALLRKPPAPAPVFGEILKIAPPAEPEVKTPERLTTPAVAVTNEGRTLKAGRVTADLERPLEEMKRLVLEFRRVHAEHRKDRRDSARRLALSELGNALGGLLRARPDLGLAYYHAALEEPHPDAIRDLAQMLELGASPELRAAMLDVLGGKGDRMSRYAAAVHLGRCIDPQSLALLLGSWAREDDVPLRERIVSSLIVNLRHRDPADPGRLGAFEVLRRHAREDAVRRVESLGILVEAQDGRVPESDRRLVREAADVEGDALQRRRLEHIAGRIRQP